MYLIYCLITESLIELNVQTSEVILWCRCVSAFKTPFSIVDQIISPLYHISTFLAYALCLMK